MNTAMSLDTIQKALHSASEKSVEVYYSALHSTEVSAFKGKTSGYTVSSSSGLSARVAHGGKIGLSYTEQITEDTIQSCIRRAEENAEFTEQQEGNKLYEREEEFHSAEAYASSLETVTAQDKKRFAREIEHYALEYDRRIINVPHAIYEDSIGELAVVNTHGIVKTLRATTAAGMCYLMASDGEDIQIGLYIQLLNATGDLDPRYIAEQAAEEALHMLNAREIHSGSYPVVFSNHTASQLLGAFLTHPDSPFFGENMVKGISKLQGKEDTRIGSELCTITDRPLEIGPRFRPFDDEGVATAECTVIDEGRFAGPIHNIYSAVRSGTSSTGHGRRGSYTGGLGTAFINPCLREGEKSEKELIGETSKGLYVTTVEGLHAGLDPVSGDFSLAAKGFSIEHGAIGDPVKNITVAGNFFELLSAIEGKADNRRRDDSTAFSSPSLLIGSLSVSGA